MTNQALRAKLHEVEEAQRLAENLRQQFRKDKNGDSFTVAITSIVQYAFAADLAEELAQEYQELVMDWQAQEIVREREGVPLAEQGA